MPACWRQRAQATRAGAVSWFCSWTSRWAGVGRATSSGRAQVPCPDGRASTTAGRRQKHMVGRPGPAARGGRRAQGGCLPARLRRRLALCPVDAAWCGRVRWRRVALSVLRTACPRPRITARTSHCPRPTPARHPCRAHAPVLRHAHAGICRAPRWAGTSPHARQLACVLGTRSPRRASQCPPSPPGLARDALPRRRRIRCPDGPRASSPRAVPCRPPTRARPPPLTLPSGRIEPTPFRTAGARTRPQAPRASCSSCTLTLDCHCNPRRQR